MTTITTSMTTRMASMTAMTTSMNSDNYTMSVATCVTGMNIAESAGKSAFIGQNGNESSSVDVKSDVVNVRQYKGRKTWRHAACLA